jgi:DNA-binding PadR family transcriptional regulator
MEIQKDGENSLNAFWVFRLDELARKILEFLARDGEHTSGEIYRALMDFTPDRGRIEYRLLTLAADGLVERRVVTPKVIMWKATDKGKKYIEEQQ